MATKTCNLLMLEMFKYTPFIQFEKNKQPWIVFPSTTENDWDPILTNTFIRGVSNNDEVGQTGGSDNAIVVSHNHSITGSISINSGGDHSHSTNFPSSSSPQGPYGGGYVATGSYVLNGSRSSSSSSEGSHSHGVSNKLGVSTEGSSKVGANIPGYTKVIFWRYTGV